MWTFSMNVSCSFGVPIIIFMINYNKLELCSYIQVHEPRIRDSVYFVTGYLSYSSYLHVLYFNVFYSSNNCMIDKMHIIDGFNMSLGMYCRLPTWDLYSFSNQLIIKYKYNYIKESKKTFDVLMLFQPVQKSAMNSRFGHLLKYNINAFTNRFQNHTYQLRLDKGHFLIYDKMVILYWTWRGCPGTFTHIALHQSIAFQTKLSRTFFLYRFAIK